MSAPTLRERAYDAAIRVAVPLLHTAAPFHSKLRRGVDARRRLGDRLEEWGARHRDPGRPLAWFHAPSLGEGLMAGAILERLRATRPDLQVAFTHFSPSAERLATEFPADLFDYLPWDTARGSRRALDALRPDALVFVRTEVWPALAAAADRRGCPTALVNAVVNPGSGRLGRAGRFLLGPVHGRLALAGAVAEEDAAALRRLGARPEAVRVTGDARFDQVWARTEPLRRGELPPAVARLREDGIPALVAGSTWPPDEARLLPALAPAVLAGRLRLVLAPHEPSPVHLDGAEARLQALGLAHRRLSALEQAPSSPLPPAVIVDRVGVLADLYASGTLAFVGGGFGRAGLHSVVEPAALAVPVLHGPAAGGAREATELDRAGGGFAGVTAEDFAALADALLRDAAARARAGEAALGFVRGRLGGAAANAEAVAALLPPPGDPEA